MMAAGPRNFCYEVDAHDRIVLADANWFAFAQENGAAHLTEDFVVGRPIWNFLEGATLRHLFEEIHRRIRTTGRPVVLPFRCDSPTLQRHMKMAIFPLDQGHLRYNCKILRVVPQHRLNLLDWSTTRSSSCLTVCSCCKRGLLESRGWLDLHFISVRLRLFESPNVPRIRHCVCPECAATLQQAAENGNAA